MSATTLSDHDITLAIPGEVESVRLRLIEATFQCGISNLSLPTRAIQ